MTETGDKKKKVIGAGDPLFLQSSDVPGTVLVPTLLNGDNYVTWSRSMKMALGEKVKLGFINGKISMPEDEESEEFEQWMRVDYMVRSWIHSSLTKDISDSFNFTTTAHELWTELKGSFGECKGPLLFQIQKDIITAEQGNMSISQYYTKMKKLWNEFHSLLPFPECKCGASKKMSQIYDSLKLLQLLNGLNESFNAVKDQLLMTEPLPDVGRTYALLQNVEKQRKMQGNCSNINENSANVARKGNFKPGIQSGNSQKQASSSGKPPYIKIDKSGLKCSECGYNGHTSETCFKLHGTPDWYLEMQEARKAAKRNFANTAGINITKKTSSEVQKDIKGKARVGSANTSYVDKAPDIFGEFFGLSNPFGGMGGGGGSRFDNSIFGVDDIVSSFGKRQSMNSEPTKAPPIEQKLPCTLEELYKGTTKRMKISRERVEASRKTLPLEEILTIDIKPGWKKGTKITFEEKGNEQPNVIPADLVFIIDEKPHDVFTRDGNDLIITQKISLTEALTGYTFCLMTLDGRSLNIPINSVIHPNYEEVVPKEGMPISKAPSRKGNLKIKFDIKFPIRFSAEQKSEFKKLTSP